MNTPYDARASRELAAENKRHDDYQARYSEGELAAAAKDHARHVDRVREIGEACEQRRELLARQ